MTTTYNLQKLIAQTVDVELTEPETGTPTGIKFTLRASFDPKIQSQVSLAYATLPPAPKEDASIGEIINYHTADQLATRKITIARTVKTNHPDLSTPEQIEEFLTICDYTIIQELQSGGSNRGDYFR